MSKFNPNQKTIFFWQGALILLPVAVLAVVSLVALHQDERAAEADARNRAAENVQSLARAMRSSVNDELQRFLTLQNVWMIGLRLAGQPSVSGEFPDANLKAGIEKPKMADRAAVGLIAAGWKRMLTSFVNSGGSARRGRKSPRNCARKKVVTSRFRVCISFTVAT